jgi:hypothetical protein
MSAFLAKDLLYLRKSDGVTMNKSRLLADAKAKALEMAADFKPQAAVNVKQTGASGLAALSVAVDDFYLKGLATPYDVVVGNEVAKVLTGGNVSPREVTQDQMRALEKEGFMRLVHDSRTLARIESIIKTGKPLRDAPIPGKKASALRAELERPGKLSKLLKRGGRSLRHPFGTAAEKPASNDNATPRKKFGKGGPKT